MNSDWIDNEDDDGDGDLVDYNNERIGDREDCLMAPRRAFFFRDDDSA